MPPLNDGPPVACPHCGQVLGHGSVAELAAHVAELQEQLHLVERELRGKRTKISRLQGDALDKLTASPHYQVARRVLAQWRRACMPNAREIESERRLRPVINRLEGGYDEHTLNLANLGYSKYPYVVEGRRQASGPADRKFVDAELIFRDAKHVDQGLRLWERGLHDEAVK